MVENYEGPIVVDDVVTTDEDTPVTIFPLQNDTDPLGNDIQITGVYSFHGMVVINDDGSLTYTPNEDFTGYDFFEYLVTTVDYDGEITGYVDITINPVNDAPYLDDFHAYHGFAVLTDGYNLAQPFLYDYNFLDPEGDDIQIIDVSSNVGEMYIDDTGTVWFQSELGYEGYVDFVVTVADEHGASTTVSSDLEVLFDYTGPYAENDEAETDEDTTIIISPLDNDIDPLDNTIEIDGAYADNGTVEILDNNQISYTPYNDFHGEDTIYYYISPSNYSVVPINEQNFAEIEVVVNPINDAPVLEETVYIYPEDSDDTSFTFEPDYIAYDPEGDEFSIISASAQEGEVTINDDGSLTYELPIENSGGDVITIVAEDEHGARGEGEMEIYIGYFDEDETEPNDAGSGGDDDDSGFADALMLIIPLMLAFMVGFAM